MKNTELPTFLSLKEEKDSIVSLVLFYQDKSQEPSAYFDEIIDEINKCNSPKELEYYWRITDNWIRQHAQESSVEY